MSLLAPTLQAFFTDRLLIQRQASPRTVAAYRDSLRLLLGFAQQRTGTPPCRLDLADLDAELVAAFLTHLEHDRGNGVRTRNARLAAIHSLFRFAALRHPEHAELIQRVLAIPAKRYDRALVCFLTTAEVDALLAAPDRSTWLGRRDHALLVLAIQTGLRVSELTSLTAADLHLADGPHVRCHGKGRKERATPLTSQTVAVLRAWTRERPGAAADPVFPTREGHPLSVDAIQWLLAKHVRAAAQGCPSLRAKHVSPHVLRHTCAVNLLRAGVDIATIALWLGHFSGEETASPTVSSGACAQHFCRTFCLLCATWTSVHDAAAEGCREVVACRADRHARLLDGGRRGLGAGGGCRRLSAASASRGRSG